MYKSINPDKERVMRYHNYTITNTIAACVAAIILASCGTVAFTGRKQMLLFSDSDITELSKSSYKEFMSTAGFPPTQRSFLL